jgi:uncharacterized caspase-like protein
LKHLNKGVPIALVIANSKYKEKTLMQPVNDAKAVKKVLTKIGFRVIFKTELNKRAMDHATRDLSYCLRTTQDIGLFYFTGYGMQFEGKNYLLPINVDIEDEADVKFNAFPVDKILYRLKKIKNDLNIIILDASRENPYPNFGHQGLANMSPPKGFFVALSTDIGQIVREEQGGRNSLYVTELVKILEKAKQNHVRIEDVFMGVAHAVEQKSHKRQMPWYTGSLRKRFCFGGCKEKPRQKTKKDRSKVKLIVLSNVMGATLFINGRNYGLIRRGKRTLKLPVGQYTVLLKKRGYVSVKQKIHLPSTRKISFDLKPEPPPIKIRGRF